MKLFSLFNPKKIGRKFVRKEAFEINLQMQKLLTPKTLDQLHKLGVPSCKEQAVEFFFYTNSAEKAGQLAAKLNSLNYTIYDTPSGANRKRYSVIGMTTKMKMEDEVMTRWAQQMCELGYLYDCEFDGWGTMAGDE